MARRRFGSIGARLTLWYVALLGLMLVGFSAVLLISLARGLDAGLDRMLNDEARQASGILTAVSGDRELREEFRRLNVGTIVGLYDHDTARFLAGRPLPPPLEPGMPISTEPRFETVSLPDGTRWRTLTLEVAQADQPRRVLVVARSAGFVQAAISQLWLVIGVTAPLALVVAIAGGAFVARRALRPIEQIRHTAEAISAQDLSRRLGVPKETDEVGRLAATFDHMLDRLDQAFERQRRFTADASHELRTPLAMLVSRAGMALERRRTAREYEAVLQAIRDDGLRLGRLVNDLLMLARADAGDALELREQLDAGELVRSVVDAMTPLAIERGVQLSAQSDEGIGLVGDQTRLTQLLVNLVDNALSHTGPGGCVTLTADDAGELAVLRVVDTGSGIAPEHLPHVFQRFYRADRGRARERGGAGLGLALCQSIAQAHGGDISLESRLGEGTRVAVALPSVRLAKDAAAPASIASPARS